MIARIWRGATPAEKSETYLEYLHHTGLKDYAATPGNRGAMVLRRIAGAQAEFVVVSFWESMDAIRAFAGPQPERAVYYPADKEFLLAFEPLVEHYEVAAEVQSALGA